MFSIMTGFGLHNRSSTPGQERYSFHYQVHTGIGILQAPGMCMTKLRMAPLSTLYIAWRGVFLSNFVSVIQLLFVGKRVLQPRIEL